MSTETLLDTLFSPYTAFVLGGAGLIILVIVFYSFWRTKFYDDDDADPLLDSDVYLLDTEEETTQTGETHKREDSESTLLKEFLEVEYREAHSTVRKRRGGKTSQSRASKQEVVEEAHDDDSEAEESPVDSDSPVEDEPEVVERNQATVTTDQGDTYYEDDNASGSGGSADDNDAGDAGSSSPRSETSGTPMKLRKHLRRQWTHTNFDGTMEPRIHKKKSPYKI